MDDRIQFKPHLWHRFVSSKIMAVWTKAQQRSGALTPGLARSRFALHEGFAPGEFAACPGADDGAQRQPRRGDARHPFIWVGGLVWGWERKGLDVFVALARHRCVTSPCVE